MTRRRGDEPAVCARCGQTHTRCSAHNRRGGACGQNPLPGQRVCHLHGGKSPAALAGARDRLQVEAARLQLVALGQPVDVDPAAALLGLVHAKAGEVAWLRDRVRETAGPDGTDHAHLVWGETSEVHKGSGEFPGTDTTSEAKPNVWWQLLRTAEDQLADYATRALKAGIEERRVRLAEDQGLLVAGVIRRILGRLDLTAAQLELVPVVVPAELRALEAGGPA